MGVAVSHQQQTLQHQYSMLCINSSFARQQFSYVWTPVTCTQTCVFYKWQTWNPAPHADGHIGKSFPAQPVLCTPDHCAGQPHSPVHPGLLKASTRVYLGKKHFQSFLVPKSEKLYEHKMCQKYHAKQWQLLKPSMQLVSATTECNECYSRICIKKCAKWRKKVTE